MVSPRPGEKAMSSDWLQRLARCFGSHSQFAVVVSDIKVKNMFFSVHSGKSHNIEQTLVVLDGLDANGTPLAEIFSDVVMLGIDPRVVSGRLDHNRFANDEPSHFTSAML
jgi:hypothetical protein